jgi:D-3-phosphoglycerate dehydrogenase
MSARHEAEALNMSIKGVAESAGAGRATWIRVTLSGGEEIHTATGAISRSGAAHLIGLGGYEVDTWLKGVLLVMRNTDEPGVIGAVGSALGKREINVSRVTVSPDTDAGDALALWSLEGDVPEDVLEELRLIEHIQSVQKLTL